AHQLFRVGTDARRVGAAPAIVDADVAAVAPAELLKRLPERRQVRPRFRIILDERVEHADPADTVCLLRPRRQRPRHRAADQRDDLAALHSIPSSARASTLGGISRPSALAVLRLITSSNLVGCSTGSSAGFAPLKILST